MSGIEDPERDRKVLDISTFDYIAKWWGPGMDAFMWAVKNSIASGTSAPVNAHYLLDIY
jgi:hypothetical protein